MKRMAIMAMVAVVMGSVISGCVAIAASEHHRFGGDREVFVVNDRAYLLDKHDGQIKELDVAGAPLYKAPHDDDAEAD